MTTPSRRPARLLYFSDVPVNHTVAGAAVVYRTLGGHPPDLLKVVESDLSSTPPGKGLPGVEYDRIRVGRSRLLHTRFASWYSAFLLTTAAGRGKAVAEKYRDWKPDGVLTVAHHYSYFSAATVADRLNIPLHLIVHDDPLNTINVPPIFVPTAERMFADVYKRAANRLVVSPTMGDLYQKQYGVPADVMYPRWPQGDSPFDAPPERNLPPGSPVTFGYAGSVWNKAYADSLTALVDVIEPMGHQFVFWTNWDTARIKEQRLDRPCVKILPFMPSAQVIHGLRENVDVVYVPMSFDEIDKSNMTISFPSKLTDYTAAALPILLRAPGYADAVRWARDNSDAAAFTTDPSPGGLKTAVNRLVESAETRRKMGAASLAAGRKYFSAAAAASVLEKILTV